MTLREKIEVMEAFERGEEIECSWTNCGTKWEIVKSPSWDWTSYLYRIKPKPKQTVVIEKWLLTDGTLIDAVETSDIVQYLRNSKWKKVKLIDTYEVTL
jgi:hypothetical protein